MIKNLLSIFFLALSVHSYAQSDRIDSLISKITNNNLTLVCNYACIIKNKSKEVDTLIKIGKEYHRYLEDDIVKKLFLLLTDTGKGIIAHYIMTNILYADSISQSIFYFYDADETFEYDYNSLRFHSSKNRQMFADSSELNWNRKRWNVILKSMSILK